MNRLFILIFMILVSGVLCNADELGPYSITDANWEIGYTTASGYGEIVYIKYGNTSVYYYKWKDADVFNCFKSIVDKIITMKLTSILDPNVKLRVCYYPNEPDNPHKGRSNMIKFISITH